MRTPRVAAAALVLSVATTLYFFGMHQVPLGSARPRTHAPPLTADTECSSMFVHIAPAAEHTVFASPNEDAGGGRKMVVVLCDHGRGSGWPPQARVAWGTAAGGLGNEMRRVLAEMVAVRRWAVVGVLSVGREDVFQVSLGGPTLAPGRHIYSAPLASFDSASAAVLADLYVRKLQAAAPSPQMATAAHALAALHLHLLAVPLDQVDVPELGFDLVAATQAARDAGATLASGRLLTAIVTFDYATWYGRLPDPYAMGGPPPPPTPNGFAIGFAPLYFPTWYLAEPAARTMPPGRYGMVCAPAVGTPRVPPIKLVGPEVAPIAPFLPPQRLVQEISDSIHACVRETRDGVWVMASALAPDVLAAVPIGAPTIGLWVGLGDTTADAAAAAAAAGPSTTYPGVDASVPEAPALTLAYWAEGRPGERRVVDFEASLGWCGRLAESGTVVAGVGASHTRRTLAAGCAICGSTSPWFSDTWGYERPPYVSSPAPVFNAALPGVTQHGRGCSGPDHNVCTGEHNAEVVTTVSKVVEKGVELAAASVKKLARVALVFTNGAWPANELPATIAAGVDVPYGFAAFSHLLKRMMATYADVDMHVVVRSIVAFGDHKQPSYPPRRDGHRAVLFAQLQLFAEYGAKHWGGASVAFHNAFDITEAVSAATSDGHHYLRDGDWVYGYDMPINTATLASPTMVCSRSVASIRECISVIGYTDAMSMLAKIV